jgi:hypothetical protein
MIMTRMLMGGAIIPRMPAMAMNAPVLRRESPSFMRTGATSGPAARTATVDDPVIIPGNMTMIVEVNSRRAFRRWKVLRRKAARLSRAPEACRTFMKRMAVRMMTMTSK